MQFITLVSIMASQRRLHYLRRRSAPGGAAGATITPHGHFPRPCAPRDPARHGHVLPETLPATVMDRFCQVQPCAVDDIDQVPWVGEVSTFLRAFQVKSVMVAPIH